MSELDQFYTKPEVAEKCFKKCLSLFARLHGSAYFIEPSAGDGAFYRLLPKGRRIGFDLAPKHKGVIKRDFLKTRFKHDNSIVIGNPPFGKRGKLAVEFVNKALTIADTVAFIVPVIFRKYFIHKQINPSARLIKCIGLEPCSFRTFSKADYCVNTEFQVWTARQSGHKDKRLFEPPPTKHEDFKLYQYNNTEQALKVFDSDFDFAVPCQGYQDYTRKETDADRCERHKQWMLVKAGHETAYEILHEEIDYEALAHKNITTIPGFRKGDLIQEYTETKHG